MDRPPLSDIRLLHSHPSPPPRAGRPPDRHPHLSRQHTNHQHHHIALIKSTPTSHRPHPHHRTIPLTFTRSHEHARPSRPPRLPLPHRRPNPSTHATAPTPNNRPKPHLRSLLSQTGYFPPPTTSPGNPSRFAIPRRRDALAGRRRRGRRDGLVAYDYCVPRSPGAARRSPSSFVGAERDGRDDGARDVVGAHEYRCVGAGGRVYRCWATGKADDREDERLVVGMGLCALAHPLDWRHVLSPLSITIRATPVVIEYIEVHCSLLYCVARDTD